MKNQEDKLFEIPKALPYVAVESDVGSTSGGALNRIEAALDEGLEEGFSTSDFAAIDTRPPEQSSSLKAGRHAMRAIDINCVVEYQNFIIELNAEERNSKWFATFQIFKDSIVVLPWRELEEPPSLTKKIAIKVAVDKAIATIRGGLSTLFSELP